MMKVVMALVSTAVGLVLLLSFKAQSASAPRSALAGADPGVPSTAVTGPSTAVTGPSSPSRPHAKKRPKGSARPAGRTGTFTGNPISTPYGTMQVAAVISNGTLTDIKLLQETDGGHSHRIDDAAIPVLKSAALAAHSAKIDIVSGATYTSQGYAQSLQSALDKAGI
ncbi:MAG: FMN-binding protein [Actinomycetia bacterium]|nr:FMN-binding protein [Actinomycetes bacterium]